MTRSVLIASAALILVALVPARAVGFLLPEDVERAVSENVALYDRIMTHAPDDPSCQYLFAD